MTPTATRKIPDMTQHHREGKPSEMTLTPSSSPQTTRTIRNPCPETNHCLPDNLSDHLTEPLRTPPQKKEVILQPPAPSLCLPKHPASTPNQTIDSEQPMT